MAKVIRYFSVAGAGLADGTSVANAAALFTGGNWSNVIRNFAFTAGADSLECRIFPGTYTVSALSAATFTAGAPTRTKCLFFVGADSKSGEPLPVPNPTWSSAQPIWDTTNMPILDFGSNTQNTAHVHFYMMRLTGSNTAGTIGSTGRTAVFTWCEIVGTGTNTGGLVAGGEATNCVIRCTSANYADVFLTVGNGIVHNVRVEGNSSAVGGGRRGFRSSSNGGQFYTHCTSIDNVGEGYQHTVAATSPITRMFRCLSYNNGTGTDTVNATTLTSGFQQQISQCMIVNNSTYGIDYAQSPTIVTDSRFRNNTSGNYTTTSIDQGIFINNDESAGTDADEFVDAAGKDFRIKNTSTIWGKGYGPMDEPAAGGTRAYFG
jgi:hypothetical protein